MSENFDNKEILLFDGVCNFCNSSVQFIIRHERKPSLSFASLQSPTGAALLKKYGLADKNIDSLVYINKGRLYIKSSAALRLAGRLKGLYPLLMVFLIVPPFIRNAVYDWIARNRYKWFGKKDACMIPDPALRARFVDL